MPSKIKKAKVDLMYFPHFNIPIFYFGKFIVEIHDLTPMKFKNIRTKVGIFRFLIKDLTYKILIRLAVKRAQKIITISKFVKKEIINTLKVPSFKIKVIYGASGIKIGQIREQDNILEKLKVAYPFIIYVGNAYPHKNLERLIFAFRKLVIDYKLNLNLVLVGKEDFFYKKLKEKVKNLGLFDKIIFTDYLSDEELLALYRKATFFVFPSLSEGFGIPALEAASLGLPVCSSNSSSLPEVLGEAALFFNPYDIDDIAAKIKKLLDDKNLQEDLKKKGLIQVKKYSWEKMAEEILEVFQEVTEN